jgi:O-antigen/teichoic acid export membrane protein
LAKIIYGRFTFGYGNYLLSRHEMLMLLSSFLTFFWVSSICNTLVPFYHSSDGEKQKRILFNAFAVLTIFSLFAGIITAVYGNIKYPKDADLFQMFGLVVFLNTPTFITDYIFYLKGKYKSLIIWGIVSFSLHIILLCVPLYMKQTLNLAVNLLVILALLKFNYTIIILMKYASISFHTRLIQEFMGKVLPFMFSILLAGSMDYINSFIVEYYYSDTDFTIFRYGAKELPIFLILANSLSNIYSGEIADAFKLNQLQDGLKRLKESSKKLMRWLFPTTILMLFISEYFFEIAYNKDLVAGYRIFNIYLLLIVSRMLFPQTVIMGLMKSRIFYLVSTNYLILNVILSFWFISQIGIEGIAYATVIAYTVEKIMLVIYCKMEGIDVREYTAIGEYLIYASITLGAFYLSLHFSFADLLNTIQTSLTLAFSSPT